MTIDRMIERLTEIREVYGNVDVYLFAGEEENYRAIEKIETGRVCFSFYTLSNTLSDRGFRYGAIGVNIR